MASAARRSGNATGSWRCGMMRNVTKALSILERPVYGVSEAAGLLGLRSDRALAWLNGYERSGVRYPPVIRREPTGDDIVT